MTGIYEILKRRRMVGIALVAIMAGVPGAAAQTAGFGGQVAANPPSASEMSALGATPAPAGFIISATLGLGKLDFSGLTGGLVRDGDAPRVSASSNGTAGTGTQATRPADETTVETETSALIESSIETIQRTTTDTKPAETTVAALQPVATIDVPSSDTGAIGDSGDRGTQVNNGVGNGDGGGKKDNRGHGDDDHGDKKNKHGGGKDK